MTAPNTALKGVAGRVRPARADPPYKSPANEQGAGLGSPTITLGAPDSDFLARLGQPLLRLSLVILRHWKERKRCIR
jgi:hypothetical protein